jgi:Flp pilus assembly protein TadG
MSLFSRFCANNRGNIAIMFGLAAAPAIMGMGLAVDYSRASNARTELQAAVDGAAIAAARSAPTMSDAELKDYARSFFDLNLQNASFDVHAFTAERDGKAVIVKSSGTIDTALMGIFSTIDPSKDYSSLPVVAEARVAYKSTKVEVSLVLDNTGSMGEQNRLVELKKAAGNFVDVLEDASYAPDAVKISVVPFSTRIKLKADSYREANWLQFDGVRKANWQGCIDERDKPNNTNMTAPIQNRRETLYRATDCSGFGALAEITRLTNDFDGIRETISDMQAVGLTNITLGTHWGEMTLASGGLFADGAQASNPEVEKFMIVLTDGDNTRNRWNDSVRNMKRDTLAACDSAKKAGIKVYTILLVDGDEDMLRQCASSASTFTYVSSASQLDSVFRGIAEEIGNIRLTN